MPGFAIAILTEEGVARVLDGKVGATFPIHHTTEAIGGGEIAHVMDYRYPRTNANYQIWSLSPGDWKLLDGDLPPYLVRGDRVIYNGRYGRITDTASIHAMVRFDGGEDRWLRRDDCLLRRAAKEGEG